MKHAWAAVILSCAVAAGASAQQQPPPVPQPYPQPGQPAPSRPAQPAPPAPAQAAPVPPRSGGQPAETPGEANLGVPIYPSAQFLVSYDAGRGQRYYLFGATASFADVVAYYKSVLKQKGELVFDEPATQMFEIGRFREESMAFPPSITVKDYTWGGSRGYLNPKPGGQPDRFPTIVQVVPIPPATTEPRR